MQRSRQSILPVVALALAFAAGTVAAATPASPFQGRVRDIDFSSLRTHIIMSGTAAADELVGTVTDDRLQAVLEAAFISGRTAQVVHKNGVISSVTLVGEPTLCSAKGCVETLKCTLVRCEATISGHSGPVTTTSRRAVDILLTAINDRSVVSELAVNGSGRITRVKVNKP